MGPVTFRCRAPAAWRGFGWWVPLGVPSAFFVAILWLRFGGWPLLVGVALAVLLLAAVLWPVLLVVDRHGLRIRVYGRWRTIAYSAIADVAIVQRLGDGVVERSVMSAVRITLHDGQCIDVGVGVGETRERFGADVRLEGQFGVFDREAHRILRAIRERMREGPDTTGTTDTGAGLFGRGALSVREWMQHIGTLRGGNYRALHVPDEALWRVVEDPSARADERAGAALALRDGLDDDGRARLRIAASACDSTRLRVAMEAVIDDEAEGRLERTFESLSD